MEVSLDTVTTQIIGQRGIAPGWSCWEVGAGTGSIAAWLMAQVGASGSVLATDIDLSFTHDPVTRSGVQVLQHDVVRDPAPSAEFDLVHARLVLEHLPEREAVLRKLAASLAPGGWLVVEDVAVIGPRAEPRDASLDKLLGAWRSAFPSWDSEYGQELVPAMRRLGLSEIGGRLSFGYYLPGCYWPNATARAINSIAGELLSTQLVTDHDVQEVIRILTDRDYPGTITSGGVLSAWARAGTS